MEEYEFWYTYEHVNIEVLAGHFNSVLGLERFMFRQFLCSEFKCGDAIWKRD